MNMFGSEVPVRAKSAAGAAPFLDTLGLMANRPMRALGDVRSRPSLAQAVIVVFLALLARSFPLTGEAAASAGQIVLSGFCFWFLFTGAYHLVSRLFKKRGDFTTFLCLTGWSTVVFWLALPLSLLFSKTEAPNLVMLLIKTAFLYLAWHSLQIHYGWSKGKAALLMFFPIILLAAVVVVTGTFFTFSLVSGLLIGKILF